MAEVNAEEYVVNADEYVVRLRRTATSAQLPAAPVTQAAVIFTDSAVTRISLLTPPITEDPPYMLAMGTAQEVHVEWREALRIGRLMVLEALTFAPYGSIGQVLLNPAAVEAVYTEAKDVKIVREDQNG